MKVLILSASTGAGHMKAAQAIESYINYYENEPSVRIVDAFEYISHVLNLTITEGYEHMAKKFPKLFGALYKSSNYKSKLSSFIGAFTALISSYLLPLIKDYNPDIIITTHPFTTEMVANLKEKGKIKLPILCIMTDYAPHRTWLHEKVDSYVVASEDMIPLMNNMGVPKNKVHPFGIPVQGDFYTVKNKESILKKEGLNQNVATILIMAGSFGVRNIFKIYSSIMEIELEFQTIVITGKNRRLFEAFKKRIAKEEKLLKNSNSKKTKLLYFTDEISKYMQVADLIITKPGGLTVSEALACNLPLAIFDAIPGQEEENANFLISNNMAIRIQDGQNCKDAIKNLLQNRSTLEKMKMSCETFDKSESGKNIYFEVKNLISSNIKEFLR